MKLTAALCWWDESPELLYQCVHAVGAFADAIVALDGAYSRYPDATPRSPKGQADAIRDAASDRRIDALVIEPDRLWAGQLEKRTHLMNAAAAQGDWIATVDADWVVEGDRDWTRCSLLSANQEIACFTVEHYMVPGDTVPTAWARNLSGTSVPVPHFWRATAAPFRVEQRHWWVSASVQGGRGWVAGGQGNGLMNVDSHAFPASYRILHRALERDELRARRNRAFCNDRVWVLEKTGQEDDDPSLPRPVFDYESLLA